MRRCLSKTVALLCDPHTPLETWCGAMGGGMKEGYWLCINHSHTWSHFSRLAPNTEEPRWHDMQSVVPHMAPPPCPET